MAAVVGWCVDNEVALVPFGGGTSVVGGLAARRDGYAGVIALDLRRMTRLLAVDEVSGTATLEAGLLGPEAEALLAEHGLTIGHFPQSFQYASIGGFAATRSSGQSSAGLRALRLPGDGAARSRPRSATWCSAARRPTPPDPTCASS